MKKLKTYEFTFTTDVFQHEGVLKYLTSALNDVEAEEIFKSNFSSLHPNYVVVKRFVD